MVTKASLEANPFLIADGVKFHLPNAVMPRGGGPRSHRRHLHSKLYGVSSSSTLDLNVCT